MQAPPTPPPRAKKGLFIAIGAVALALVFVVIGIFATSGNLEHWYLKNFGSPAAYYQYIEKQETKWMASSFLTGYDLLKSHPLDDTQTDVNLKLALGEDAISLASYYTDISWLKETEIDFALNYKGDYSTMDAKVKLGSENLLTAKIALDMMAGLGYLQVPELTAQYLGVDMSNYGANFDNSGLLVFSDIQRSLPATADMEKLAQKYLGIVIENINNVKKSRDTLEVEGISQKCTVLTVTVDEETVHTIIEAILTEMLTDDGMGKVLDALLAMAGYPTYYGDYRDKVEVALARIRDITDFAEEDDIVMTLWVDDAGRVRGRHITAASEGDVYYYYMPMSGKDFGYEATVVGSDSTTSLIGSGEYAGDKISGAFKLRYEDGDMLNIAVSDFDAAKAKEGYLNGSFVVTPAPAFNNFLYLAPELPGILNTIIAGYSLQVDITSAKDDYQVKVTALDGKEAVFAAIDAAIKLSGGQNVAIPTDNITMMGRGEGLFEWALTIDGEAVIADLKRRFDIPAELMEQLEDLFAMLNMYKMFGF